jgi:hypothetical protein
MFGDMIDRFGTGFDVAAILREVECRSEATPMEKAKVSS